MTNRYLTEGAEQQSWWNELQSADYLFPWEETRTSPAAEHILCIVFVLCKLSTYSIRAPWVGKSIFIQLEWLIFRWTVSFIVLCVFHNTVSSSFQSFFPFYLSQWWGQWCSIWVFSPHSKKSGSYVFKASRSSRKSKVFLGERVYLRVERSWSEKVKRSQREGSDNAAFVLGATAAVLLHFGSPNKNITLRK